MNARVPNLSRRQFIVGTSAITTGLAIGLEFPNVIGTAHAQTADKASAPEIGVWVVIQPNDTVVIRVVRSEMGQGTITGLAQLVAEELECDWKKITIDYPTPGESLKRKGVWGSFSTGGSRGIRTSEDYVRKGGALPVLCWFRRPLISGAFLQPNAWQSIASLHIKRAAAQRVLVR